MKYFRQWRFSLVAAVSLLLCVAVIGISFWRPTSAVDLPTRSSEKSISLTGIVQENDQFVAYFEEKDNGTRMVRRTNDRIANGRITEITMEGIVYNVGANSIRIRVGEKLAGNVSLANGLP